MSRLEKKCFITATAAHGLLVLILFVGPAFFVSPEKNDSFKPITVYSTDEITKALTDGGTPQNVRAVPLPPAPAPAVQEQPKPVVEPPKPPEIVKPAKPEVHDLEVPKPVVKATKPVEHGDEVAPPKKRTPTLSPDELVSSVTDRDKAQKKAAEDARARAQAREAREAKQRAEEAREFGNALKSLKNNLSGSTLVKMPVGDGHGGAASVNYRDLIASKFYSAWNPAFNLAEDTSDVTVTITITRDGNVTGHITKRSGNSNMDRSVQNALDQVNFIEPFPSSFREEQMTVPIIFNLRAKRQ